MVRDPRRMFLIAVRISRTATKDRGGASGGQGCFRSNPGRLRGRSRFRDSSGRSPAPRRRSRRRRVRERVRRPARRQGRTPRTWPRPAEGPDRADPSPGRPTTARESTSEPGPQARDGERLDLGEPQPRIEDETVRRPCGPQGRLDRQSQLVDDASATAPSRAFACMSTERLRQGMTTYGVLACAVKGSTPEPASLPRQR